MDISPTLERPPTQIDVTVEIETLQCPDCDSQLPKPSKWHSHIQIDIPPVSKTQTTEYKVGWSYCACCRKRVSAKDKLSGSLYGPNLHAQLAYWKYSMGLTLGKIQKMLAEQYELNLSTGVISAMMSRTAAKLEDTYDDIKTSLRSQETLYADETGWRRSGDNYWLWSFSNQEISYYRITKSRSAQVVEDVLGKSFDGVLVTDFYAGYNQLEGAKQRCWVHLLREMRELREKHPQDAKIREYLRRLKTFYKRGVKLKEKYASSVSIEKPLARLLEDTQQWADCKHEHPDLKRISKRLHKYRSELYTFITSGADPTNNHGERQIRPAVLMRKTSYCNRSPRGSKTQSVLMSVISTSAKRGVKFTHMAADHLCTYH